MSQMLPQKERHLPQGAHVATLLASYPDVVEPPYHEMPCSVLTPVRILQSDPIKPAKSL
jgi:hypothetical protein